MHKKLFRTLYALNCISQAAFCFLVPAGLLIAGGWYLSARCGWGRWVLALAIVLGVLGGVCSMFNFLRNCVVDPTTAKGENDGTKSV